MPQSTGSRTAGGAGADQDELPVLQIGGKHVRSPINNISDIVQLSIPGYEHTRVFDDIAIGLQGGFAELGRPVRVVAHPAQIRTRGIVLGANVLANYRVDAALPADAILFNLEQLTATGGWLTGSYLHLLRSHPVWDYSLRNIDLLRTYGIRARHCPIGYTRRLERITHHVDKDIDVLFYGSDFGRRTPLLDRIEATGLRVQRLFGVYGDERDQWIARSKLILNLRAYDSDVFNIVRVSYALANRCCVLSEDTLDPEAAWLRDGVAWGVPDDLPELCMNYAGDEELRADVAARGYELFKARKQAEILKVLSAP